jgi:hypothetical protein
MNKIFSSALRPIWVLVVFVFSVSSFANVCLKANHHPIKTNMALSKADMPKNLIQKSELKDRVDNYRLTAEQPSGELVTYARSGKSVYLSEGYFYVGNQDKRIDIVYGDNGKVYLKNLLYNTGSVFGDYWVVGHLNDDGTQLSVPMGQSIYHSDDYDTDVVLAFGHSVVVDDSYLTFIPDENVTEAIYKIEGGVITLQYTEGPDGFTGDLSDYEAYGLGAYWKDDGSFAGIEWNTVFIQMAISTPNVITELPEGIEATVYTFDRCSECIYYNSLWGISSSATDGVFIVAIDVENGKAYIRNPLWNYNNQGTWAAGNYDLSTGIISIPTGQYLYWNDTNEYGIQLVWGNTYVYEDGDNQDSYNMGFEIDESTSEIRFKLDENSIYLLDTSGDINAEFPDNFVATGMMGIWSDDQSFSCLEFARRVDEVELPFGIIYVPVIPDNVGEPQGVEWFDCGDESGYSYLSFRIPKFSAGVDLGLTYSIYIDNDERFVFSGEEYTLDFIFGDITEVDYWLWSNGVDFYRSKVYFYRTNQGSSPLFTFRIGIRYFLRDWYYDENNEICLSDIYYSSPITWYYSNPYDPDTTGKKGDVNGDGEITIADVNAIIDLITKGDAVGGETGYRADVNSDGEINIADVNAIIDLILNGSNN